MRCNIKCQYSAYYLKSACLQHAFCISESERIQGELGWVGGGGGDWGGELDSKRLCMTYRREFANIESSPVSDTSRMSTAG